MRVQDIQISERSKSLLTAALGLDSLYPIQELALKAGVLDGEDLLLSAPTASGKTLVPLILTLREMEEHLGKVIYMVPLRALAYEKYLEFKVVSKLSRPNNRGPRVGISTGDYDSTAESLKYNDVTMCTYEKMDSILRHRPSWLRDISTVVFDEIHLLHSVDRGPVVEMLIASIGKLLPSAQRLALSATVSNDDEIASWIACELVKSDWRPVPLYEGVYFDNTIMLSDESELVERKFGDEMMDLADHAMSDQGQILFFTPTRRQAVSLANKIAPAVSLSKRPSQVKELERLANSITQAEDNSALGNQLSSLMRRGVAFHHAGLPASQRRIVEEGFKRGLIGAITATPTLAAGVNLPARYVCVTSVHRYTTGFGPREIPVMEYKQMAGRAGRPQFDRYGVALIRATSENDAEYLREGYLGGSVEPIRSMLGQSDFFSSATLSTVASGTVANMNDLRGLFSTTLLAKQRGTRYVDWRVRRMVDYLVEMGALELNGEEVKATALGRRVSELYILPETASAIMERTSHFPRDSTDVTILHLVVGTRDMSLLMSSARSHAVIEEFLGDHLGEFFISESESSALDEAKTVLALKMWVEEATFDTIHNRLGVEPGDMHVVNEKATWLLYAASELANFAGVKELASPLARMSRRVKHGVKAELLDLVSLAGIGRARARSLYRAGFKRKSDLSRASVEELSKIPGIGSTLALSVKKQVGGLIKEKDLKREAFRQKRLLGSE